MRRLIDKPIPREKQQRLMAAQTAGLLCLCLLALTVIAVWNSEWGMRKKEGRTFGAPDSTLRIPYLAALPLSFEANLGQTDSRVKFLSRGRSYSLFLTPTEAVLSLNSPQSSPRAQRTPRNTTSALSTPSAVSLRMKLVGANPAPQVTGLEELPGKSHYFIGNDPKKWRTNVPTYARVRYEQVYPGVDLVYYGNQRQLEYDFVVAPGADPSVIQLAFQGAGKLESNAHGDLLLHAKGGRFACASRLFIRR